MTIEVPFATRRALLAMLAGGLASPSRAVPASLNGPEPGPGSASLLASRETVSIAEFGAKGDGRTDDTAAINRALATGKDLHVPKGAVCMVSGSLVPRNGQRIFGGGSNPSRRRRRGCRCLLAPPPRHHMNMAKEYDGRANIEPPAEPLNRQHGGPSQSDRRQRAWRSSGESASGARNFAEQDMPSRSLIFSSLLREHVMEDEKTEAQAGKSVADGVSNAPAKRDGSGESGGGAYPNPHTAKPDPGFDGGQSEKAYHGGQNPNATTEE